MKYVFIVLALALVVAACTPQQSCEQIISSSIKESTRLSTNQTLEMQQKNMTLQKITTITIPQGNGGINPLEGYYFVNAGQNNYYVIVKQLYSESWYGPYRNLGFSVCVGKD